MQNDLIQHKYNEEDKKFELWKDISGWVGLYRISTHGRVRSMERIIQSGNKSKLIGSRILAPATDKDGYFFVQLSRDGKQLNMRINRLVAASFIPNPLNLPLVNHIDNNVQNNCVWNLEWSTPLLNMQHSANQGRKTAPNRKLSHNQIAEIRRAYVPGLITMDALALKYNVTRPVIGNIINNKCYKNVN